MLAEEQRQWAQAEGYYQQTLAIYGEFNDRYAQAEPTISWVLWPQEQRQWAQAEEHYQKALEISDRVQRPLRPGCNLPRVGYCGPGAAAVGAGRAALPEGAGGLHEFNDRYEQATIYHQLGIVAQEQRQWAQAEQDYHKALEIYIDFKDRYFQAATYRQLGRVAEEQRQWAQAKEYLTKALAIFAEFQDNRTVAIALRNLARLWRQSGDQRIVTAVAEILKTGADEAEELLREADQNA